MVNQKVAFSKATETNLCEAMSLVIVIINHCDEAFIHEYLANYFN